MCLCVSVSLCLCVLVRTNPPECTSVPHQVLDNVTYEGVARLVKYNRLIAGKVRPLRYSVTSIVCFECTLGRRRRGRRVVFAGDVWAGGQAGEAERPPPVQGPRTIRALQ